MSEQDRSEEKTEEGSEKKTTDAIEKGNVPFSREATIFSSLGAMLIIAWLVLANNIRALVDALVTLFANPVRDPFGTTADTILIFHHAAMATSAFLLPVLVLLAVAGLVAGMAQGTPRLVLERIRPKWSKISPASGLKRLFGRDGQIEFLKSLSKFLIVSAVVGLVLGRQGRVILEMLYLEPSTIGGQMLGVVARLLAGSLAAFALVTIGDLLWSRLRWRRDLRMSRQELKDEMRQAEGDPLAKAKRRSLALDRSRRRMMAAVPKATLVVANPTHYAIALRYVREEGGAPMVLAKGKDLVALKIREIAESHAIPVIEDKALARSMYDRVEVSQMIPTEFYKAVAELIHFLQARSGATKRPAIKV